MHNIKIYDRKNTSKTTLSENTISCNFTFSATVWSGLSSLKFEYYGNYNIQHRDRIKIFKEWKIIYQWYITWIQWFFPTANNEVLFWPHEKEHHLTYWKEVFWIEISEDSTSYYNKFRINYSWWTRIEEHQNEIETYWESYQIITDSTIKNLTTAQARMNSLFQENSIKNTIKIKVNKDYDYFSILPWEILSIRNTKTIIENKPIKQIHYSKDSATILLESYTTLEDYL